jgi:hypothetical protein
VQELYNSDIIEDDGVMNSEVRRMKNACVRFSRLIPVTSEVSLDVTDNLWNEHIIDPNTYNLDEDVYIIYLCARKRMHLPLFRPAHFTCAESHIFRNRSGGNNFKEIRSRWHEVTANIYTHLYFLPSVSSLCNVVSITGNQHLADPTENDVEGMGFLPEDELYDSVANKITFVIDNEVCVMVTVESLCISSPSISCKRLEFGDDLKYLDENGNVIFTIDTQLCKV